MSAGEMNRHDLLRGLVLVASACGAGTTLERMDQLLMNVIDEDETAPSLQRV